MKKVEENQLEEMLKNMPKLKSHRDPMDVLQLIRQAEEHKEPKRTIKWLFPSIATVAAIVLFTFLGMTMVPLEHAEYADSGSEQKSTESSPNSNAKQDIQMEKENKLAYDINTEDSEATTSAKVVFEEDLNQSKVVSVLVPDQMGMNLVPVSMIISAEENPLAALQDRAGILSEQDLGLNEYYPLDATLTISEDNKTLLVDVNSSALYQYGSNGEETFKAVINQLLITLGLSKAEFTTDGSSIGIELGNTGLLTSLDVNETKNRAYYLYQPSEGSQQSYYVASNQEFGTIAEALNAMRQSVEVGDLQATIPDGLDIEILQGMDPTKLEVAVNRDSSKIDERSAEQALEAVLVAAKSFQYQIVRFTDPSTDMIGEIPLNADVLVPVALNPINKD